MNNAGANDNKAIEETTWQEFEKLTWEFNTLL